MHFDTHRFQTGPKGFSVTAVTRPSHIQAFVRQQPERFTHAEVHVDRCCVVIHAVTAPVLIEKGNVEIPIGHLVLTRSKLGFSARAHREWTKPWRAAQTLLTTAVGQIHLPFIEINGNTAKRGHGVEQEQAIVLAAEISDSLHRLTHAGGRFGMHHRQNGGLVLNQSCFELILGKCFTPRLFDHLHIGAVTTGHIHKTIPEIALYSDENGVAWFNRVGKRCFHGCTTRAAHRQGQAVVGLPGVAKKLLHFAHQLHIKRIEVTNRSPRQSLEHRWISVRGSWTEQQTIGGVNRGNDRSMGRINQPGRVRRRQSQDHQLMANSLRIDRPLNGAKRLVCNAC